MSVDKFGHYSGELVTGSKIQRGPPGEGFKLTKDGNFNINNKRLCNVGDPKTDNEAVNVKYVKQNSITLSNTSNHFDVKMKKITNLADPQEPFDAVNKIYCENTMKTSLINRIPVKVKDGSVYSFKNNRVTNVASPISKLDVVNVEYLRNNTIIFNKKRNSFDAENHVIGRLQNPKEQEDAANKFYVDNKLPNSLVQPGCCDFKNNRLINVAEPVDLTDGINKQTLDNTLNTLKHEVEEYIDKRVDFNNDGELDFKKAKLVNVSEPESDYGVVNKKYVYDQFLEYDKKLLNILYKLYKELTTDKPIKSRHEFYIIYMVQSLYEES